MGDHRVRTLLDAVGASDVPDRPVHLTGADPILATSYPVGEHAAVALGTLGASLVELHRLRGADVARVDVEVRHAAASLLSLWLLRRDGHLVSPLPPDGNPTTMSGDNPLVALYRAGDGRWIHLHGAFEHLAAATREVLDLAPGASAATVAGRVAAWTAHELEDALASAGTCGAVARAGDEWRAHPHGRIVAGDPPVIIRRVADADPPELGRGRAPLAGVRVLDATRILAGPVCGRVLAESGAEVLLVTSPSLPDFEQSVLDTGHGKRSAHLDLTMPEGHEEFLSLAAGADVVVQSYRGGSFARRGLGAETVAERRPGIVHVSISCYGQTGPWSARPGWEHLAQTATGLAVGHGASGRPQLMPVAFCDYVTGYLAALGAVEALRRRSLEGGTWVVEASLAHTATWLARGGPVATGVPSGLGDLAPLMTTGDSPFGRLAALTPPLRIDGHPGRWPRLSVPLGTDPAQWSGPVPERAHPAERFSPT